MIDVEKDDELDKMREVEAEIFLNRWNGGEEVPLIRDSNGDISPKQLPIDSPTMRRRSLSIVTGNLDPALPNGESEEETAMKQKALQYYLDEKFPPWHRWLILLQCFASPFFIVLGLNLWSTPVFNNISWLTWGLMAVICGVVCFALVWFFTAPSKRPVWFRVSFSRYTMNFFVNLLYR